jgi:AraC-like DNA-binding protein
MHFKYKGNNEGLFDLIDTAQLKFTSAQLKKDCYTVIWARNDSLILSVDGYRVLVAENHLLFASSLNKLDFEVAYKDVMIYSFNREFYCIRDHDAEVSCNGYLFLGSSLPLVVGLTEREKKSFNILYEFFVEEFEMMDHIQGEMLLVLLKRLLILSLRIARKLLPDKDMPQSKLDIIRKFNLLVEMHFREKHKVGDYAELMHITPKSVSNLFSRYFHKTPLQIINERVILEIKRLLMYSDKNINEITYLLGFKEVSHLSKFFKNHTGLSPKEYQKKLRN